MEKFKLQFTFSKKRSNSERRLQIKTLDLIPQKATPLPSVSMNSLNWIHRALLVLHPQKREESSKLFQHKIMTSFMTKEEVSCFTTATAHK